jgi:hypothetical protein
VNWIATEPETDGFPVYGALALLAVRFLKFLYCNSTLTKIGTTIFSKFKIFLRLGLALTLQRSLNTDP